MKNVSISRSSTDGSTSSSSRKSSISQSGQPASTSPQGNNGSKADKSEKTVKVDKAAVAAAAAGDKWVDKNEKQVVSTTLKKSCNWLREGMNVFVQKELGILRYIGTL